MRAAFGRVWCGVPGPMAAGLGAAAFGAAASGQGVDPAAAERAAPSGARSVLWDNGDTNGVNGVSHLGSPRRSVLDDFVVPDGRGWDITGLATRHVWQTRTQPSATGYQLTVWSDVAGEPGAPVAFMATNGLDETASGRLGLGRPEMDISVSFPVVHLEPGVYWLEMHVVGPENSFQLVHDLGERGGPRWGSFHDMGGVRPGYAVYFADYDASFTLLGEATGCGPADCDGDGAVNTRDFLCYLALWAAGDPGAECNGDLRLDTLDFLCYLGLWGEGC